MIAIRQNYFARRKVRSLAYAGVLLLAVPIVAMAMSGHSQSNDDIHRISVIVDDSRAAGLQLSLNGVEQRRVGGAGFFAFDSILHRREAFVVSIVSTPIDRSYVCSVSPASGTIANSDIALTVACARQPSLPSSISTFIARSIFRGPQS